MNSGMLQMRINVMELGRFTRSDGSLRQFPKIFRLCSRVRGKATAQNKVSQVQSSKVSNVNSKQHWLQRCNFETLPL
jgi:hypothetical protein